MRNIGTYRMQVYDRRTTGMHWQRHKGGAQHHRVAERLGKRLEVAVALGADPVLHVLRDRADARRARRADARRRARQAARRAGEVPDGRSRGAGATRRSFSKATSSPASAAAKGRSAITPGFYSLADDFPVFHLHVHDDAASNPMYVTTVVGIPPMEDYYLGKASERIFLPLIRKTLPEIVDMHFPAAGIFHNIVLVSIDKRYPGHARKIMSAFWGLGQLMFSKCIVVVDKDVERAGRSGSRVDRRHARRSVARHRRS